MRYARGVMVIWSMLVMITGTSCCGSSDPVARCEKVWAKAAELDCVPSTWEPGTPWGLVAWYTGTLENVGCEEFVSYFEEEAATTAPNERVPVTDVISYLDCVVEALSCDEGKPVGDTSSCGEPPPFLQGLENNDFWTKGPEEFAKAIEAANACDGPEIRLLAAKHNLQLVFVPCGSNNFLHFQWSPSGLELYYQTGDGPSLFNGETREVRALPAGSPASNAVWFNDDLIAFAERGEQAHNIDVYDVRKNVISVTALELVSPNSLFRGRETDEVLFLAENPKRGGGDRSQSVYRLLANTGKVALAFPWLDDPVLDYTYRASQDLVAYRTVRSRGVVVARGSTGEVIRTFEGKTRVSISEDGRYWAIEGPGEAIPGELEPPPTLWILDTESNEQTKLDDVYGHDFQWYDAAPGYCSFVLWGMENKKFNPNVVLADITTLL